MVSLPFHLTVGGNDGLLQRAIESVTERPGPVVVQAFCAPVRV